MGAAAHEHEGSPQRSTDYGLFVKMTLDILARDVFLSRADIQTIAGFFYLPPQQTADTFQRDISPTGSLGPALQDTERQVGIMSREFFHLECGQAAVYNSDKAEAAMLNAFEDFTTTPVGLSENTAVNELSSGKINSNAHKTRRGLDNELPHYLQRVLEAIQSGMTPDKIEKKLGITDRSFNVYTTTLRRKGLLNAPVSHESRPVISPVTSPTRRAAAPANQKYEPPIRSMSEASDHISIDQDTLSEAELTVWHHLSSGAPSGTVGDILRQQANRPFTDREIQQIVTSLEKKGVYPDSKNQLATSERLYGREIADFLQLIIDKSPQLVASFPNIAILQLPYTTNNHLIKKIIAATDHSNTNIRPSLRENTVTDEDYHHLLLSQVQHAFQHEDRNVWLKVFAVPERVRVDTVNLLDWLHDNYKPPQATVNLPVAV